MKSTVYFIPVKREEGAAAISQKAEKLYLLLSLNERIGKDDFVGLKIHFGEKGNTGFIKPQWLEGIITQIKGRTKRVFFTDTNTLYIGSRSNAVDHLSLAAEHGFSLERSGIPVIIADGLVGRDDGEVMINLKHIRSAKVSSAILLSDFLLCLSHLTGHVATGLGAAIKNLGMGCASRTGKLEQHSDVHPRISAKLCKNCGICLDFCPTQAIILKNGCASIEDEKCIGCGECLVVCKTGAVKMRWDEDCVRIQEKMAEYAFAVWKKFPGKIGFLNFLLKVTKDCDCMAKDQPAIAEDVGILSSLDPVALDKASAELLIKTSKKDILREGYNIDWSAQLKHGARLGLGSLNYELIEVG